VKITRYGNFLREGENPCFDPPQKHGFSFNYWGWPKNFPENGSGKKISPGNPEKKYTPIVE